MPEPLIINNRRTIPGDELTLAYSRSGGPGGQHVNTSDTRVRLSWDVAASDVLPPHAKARLQSQNPSWFNNSGALQLTCDTNRSRKRNIDEARRRLAAACRAALVVPRTRRATRPSRGSVKRRLQAKAQRGRIKKGRSKVHED